MEKVKVWTSIQNNGDGSASNMWFLSYAAAQKNEENAYEGWGDECIESVETFVGSDIYNAAVESEAELEEEEG